jgi:hypothetical protein
MTLGISLSSDRISFSYSQDMINIDTYRIDCSVGFRTIDLFNDIDQLTSLLANVKLYAESVLHESIDNAVISHPGYCYYPHIKAIKKAAASCGIKLLHTASSSHCLSYALPSALDSTSICCIMCCFFSNYTEISAIDYGDNVMELLGSTTIQFDPDSNSQNLNKLKGRLAAELKQFWNDISEMNGRHYKNNAIPIERIICCKSECSDSIETVIKDVLKEKTQLEITDIADDSISKGALLYAHKLSVGPTNDLLLVSIQTKSICVGFGENGEHKKFIDYYCTIPTKKSDLLLVSTEPKLNIYEGNYVNRKYDTLIGQISIPDFLEGHEVEVTLDIDVRYNIYVKICDDTGAIVVPPSLI